ncbi:MAG: hypothetical protein HN704_09540 [Bacteroidetes bacterium]|jgi:hypothetical protein|nr:hypothetical protein [Bacteroidota bacterium]MBT7143631.1 hypothetical protein [Bacteroidota bacterium]MBT7491837.1 hypothetical protein [Bacteroidota bacterium]
MPKVNKNILIFTAGLLWSSIGIFLIYRASTWFCLLNVVELALSIIGGIFLGIAISFFKFSKLAQENINRINLYDKKVCFWAFQKWQTYFLIIFMISLGIFMRKTSFVPKYLLTPTYIGIGFALFLASFKYHTFLYKNRTKDCFLKVKKINLILFTAIIWFWAGFILWYRAYTWLHLVTDTQFSISVIIAIIIAVIKVYFIFRKLTLNNIQRISNFEQECISIFKFHLIKDQILIVVMILSGYLLRNLSFVPKYVLMPIYMGIGFAMFYSSLLYILHITNYFKQKKI